jgi:hypothetical protein
MILLTLAMLAAPTALPAQHRARAKARAHRVVRAARPRPLLATRRVIDPNDKYRVAGSDERTDFKTRVVERGAFRDCAVTGPSICPSKGMPVVHSDLK